MKKIIIIAGVLTVGLFAATNFSSMSNEQLQNMRGSVGVAEKDAFRAEMQKRVQSGTMTKGQGKGMGQGKGQGQGQGKGQGMGMNKGENKLY